MTMPRAGRDALFAGLGLGAGVLVTLLIVGGGSSASEPAAAEEAD